MANKPVAGSVFYNSTTDRPRVALRAGERDLLTTDDSTGGAAGGDLSGTYPNPTVAKVNGVAITGTPSAGQVPVASSGSAAAWATPAVSLAEYWADDGSWHADSEEGTSVSAPTSKWNFMFDSAPLTPVTPSGPVNPVAGPSAGQIYYSSLFGTWFACQVGSNGGYSRKINGGSMPSVVQFRWRPKGYAQYPAAAAPGQQLWFIRDTGTGADITANDRLRFIWVTSGVPATVQLYIEEKQAGAVTNNVTIPWSNGFGADFEIIIVFVSGSGVWILIRNNGVVMNIPGIHSNLWGLPGSSAGSSVYIYNRLGPDIGGFPSIVVHQTDYIRERRDAVVY